MTNRICIEADQAGGLEGEAAERIKALGLEPVLLSAESAVSARQAALTGCGALVSLYPVSPGAHLALGLAAGMGLPVFILASSGEAGRFPSGARVFTGLQPLIDALPTGEAGRHVDEALLARLGACREGVDWYLGRYPGGRHSSEWTPTEQLEAFANGGAPWLSTAFDYRLIPHHPMDGADLTGADLTKLRLKAASLKGAILRQATLSEAQIAGSNLAGANLTRSNLRQAALRRDDLRQADLSNADLTEARLDRCQLDGLIARGATLASCRITASSGQGVNVSGADLSGASFAGLVLPGGDFSDANLTSTLFENCRFEGTSFQRADFTSSQFRRCRFDGADFTGANFDKAHVIP
ncbi:MAG: hypothetical protein GC145_14850 [Caulobacter sp.]|nr:hypothetical protein [Caulobacter sp.]